MKKVTAIICAFNEEKTIRDVILSVAASSIFNEIIIVNDGSTDRTKSIISDCKKTINFIDIHLSKNKGKGFAMAIGIENSSAEIIVFCDADLSDLRKEHFQQLIKPIVENEADMVLGQSIMDTFIDYSYNPFKSLTGERVLYKKDILPILEKIKTTRFGVETLINLYFKAHNKRVQMVLLYGLNHFIKFEKTNKIQALKQYLKEGKQIVFTYFNNYSLISIIMKNKLKVQTVNLFKKY